MLAYSICTFFILGICWPLYTVRKAFKARLPHCPPFYLAGVRSSFSHARQTDRYSASKLALAVVERTFWYNYSVKKTLEALLHRRDHASSSRRVFVVESSFIILFYCWQLTVNKNFHLRAHQFMFHNNFAFFFDIAMNFFLLFSSPLCCSEKLYSYNWENVCISFPNVRNELWENSIYSETSRLLFKF